MYGIEFSEKAKKDLKSLSATPKYLSKMEKLLKEVRVHPTTGTGKPERLKHYAEPTWSRRISDKHRLVYRIYDEIVVVLVISAYGHYEDK